MAGLTLRARALAALARREYSRLELARKLAPYAENHEQLLALLDQLELDRLLSATRFAESLAHRRAERYGVRRIGQELKSHGLAPDLVREQLSILGASEIERCRAVWQKRFGTLPHSAQERAKQTRFLTARGFTNGSIARVLGGDEDEG